MSDTGEFGSPGQPTTPPVYEPPSYDPPIEVVDLSTYAIPRLGCGIYAISIIVRGDGSVVCDTAVMKPTNIAFSRRLNEISEASITLNLKGADAECCACLSTVRPWRHELKIARDGVTVWVGPVMGMIMDLNNNTLKISARDLFANFDKRLFFQSADYEVEQRAITEVFNDLMQHGYARSSWAMTFHQAPVAVPIDQFYPGYDTDIWGGRYPIIGDELRSLVDAGVDFTVVGRHLYYGNVEIAFNEAYLAATTMLPTQSILMDQTWAQMPSIEVIGTYMSNYVVVGGGFTGYFGWADDQMWIEDRTASNPDGVLETVHISDSTEDVFTDEHPNPITAEARARVDFNSNPYVKLSGGQLAPDAPFGFDLLIPGLPVGLSIASACVGLDARYRIHSVSTEVSAESEAVNIELAPIGNENLIG